MGKKNRRTGRGDFEFGVPSDTGRFEKSVDGIISLVTKSRNAKHIELLCSQIAAVVRNAGESQRQVMGDILKRAGFYELAQKRLDELQENAHASRGSVIGVIGAKDKKAAA